MMFTTVYQKFLFPLEKGYFFFFLVYLQCNFRGALASYERALSVSAQREVKLLCLHEVGWSYVLLLQWEKSSLAFLKLKLQSRWSKSFYSYLSAGKNIIEKHASQIQPTASCDLKVFEFSLN